MRLSVIAPAVCLAALPSAAFGEDTPSEIVVTATRTATPIEYLPVSVSVIGEEAITEQLRQDRNILTSLEAVVPGLNAQNSEVRGSCSTRVRGRPVAFQINGIPVDENLRQGSCTGPFTISPFAIERVEMIRGGTALYGAGAPGGLVNLMTRRGRTSAPQVDFTAQTSFNTEEPADTFTTDIAAGIGQDTGAFDYYVGATYTDGGRVRDSFGAPVYSNSFDAIDLYGSFGYELDAQSSLRLVTTFHSEDLDRQFYPTFAAIAGTNLIEVAEVDPHPQVDQAVDRNFTASLSYEHRELLGHRVALSLFYQNQIIRQRDNFYFDGFGNDFFATNRQNKRFGFRGSASRDWQLGGEAKLSTTYGFDYTSNSFYRATVDPAQHQRVIGFISPEVVLRTYAPFLQGDLSLGPVTLTAGVRYEIYRGEVTNRDYDPALPGAGTPGGIGKSDLTLFNVGAIWRITPEVQLYGSYSQGAELSQLGRSARNLQMPSRLSPEPATSGQWEVGLRGQLSAVRFGLAAYRSSSDRSAELQADPSCAGQTLCPLIPLRVPQRFHGFEGEVHWAATPRLQLSAIATYQRGQIFDSGLGRYINYATDVVVPFRLTGRVEWKPVEPAKLALQATHYSASSFFTPAEEGLGFIETGAVTLLAASASYRFGRVEIYASADNLLNEDYVSPSNQASGSGSFFYYRAPGRRVTLGLTTRF